MPDITRVLPGRGLAQFLFAEHIKNLALIALPLIAYQQLAAPACNGQSHSLPHGSDVLIGYPCHGGAMQRLAYLTQKAPFVLWDILRLGRADAWCSMAAVAFFLKFASAFLLPPKTYAEVIAPLIVYFLRVILPVHHLFLGSRHIPSPLALRGIFHDYVFFDISYFISLLGVWRVNVALELAYSAGMAGAMLVLCNWHGSRVPGGVNTAWQLAIRLMVPCVTLYLSREGPIRPVGKGRALALGATAGSSAFGGDLKYEELTAPGKKEKKEKDLSSNAVRVVNKRAKGVFNIWFASFKTLYGTSDGQNGARHGSGGNSGGRGCDSGPAPGPGPCAGAGTGADGSSSGLNNRNTSNRNNIWGRFLLQTLTEHTNQQRAVKSGEMSPQGGVAASDVPEGQRHPVPAGMREGGGGTAHAGGALVYCGERDGAAKLGPTCPSGAVDGGGAWVHRVDRVGAVTPNCNETRTQQANEPPPPQQHHQQQPPYRPYIRRQSLRFKIPWAEPEQLGPGYQERLRELAEARGLNLAAVYVRRGCVELTLVLEERWLERDDRNKEERGNESGPAAAGHSDSVQHFGVEDLVQALGLIAPGEAASVHDASDTDDNPRNQQMESLLSRVSMQVVEARGRLLCARTSIAAAATTCGGGGHGDRMMGPRVLSVWPRVLLLPPLRCTAKEQPIQAGVASSEAAAAAAAAEVVPEPRGPVMEMLRAVVDWGVSGGDVRHPIHGSDMADVRVNVHCAGSGSGDSLPARIVDRGETPANEPGASSYKYDIQLLQPPTSTGGLHVEIWKHHHGDIDSSEPAEACSSTHRQAARPTHIILPPLLAIDDADVAAELAAAVAAAVGGQGLTEGELDDFLYDMGTWAAAVAVVEANATATADGPDLDALYSAWGQHMMQYARTLGWCATARWITSRIRRYEDKIHATAGTINLAAAGTATDCPTAGHYDDEDSEGRGGSCSGRGLPSSSKEAPRGFGAGQLAPVEPSIVAESPFLGEEPAAQDKSSKMNSSAGRTVLEQSQKPLRRCRRHDGGHCIAEAGRLAGGGNGDGDGGNKCVSREAFCHDGGGISCCCCGGGGSSCNTPSGQLSDRIIAFPRVVLGLLASEPAPAEAAALRELTDQWATRLGETLQVIEFLLFLALRVRGARAGQPLLCPEALVALACLGVGTALMLAWLVLPYSTWARVAVRCRLLRYGGYLLGKGFVAARLMPPPSGVEQYAVGFGMLLHEGVILPGCSLLAPRTALLIATAKLMVNVGVIWACGDARGVAHTVLVAARVELAAVVTTLACNGYLRLRLRAACRPVAT